MNFFQSCYFGPRICGATKSWAENNGRQIIWAAKESFLFWVAKECLLLWVAKECLPQVEKEFLSYAAKIREGKDRESTELQPVSSGKLRFQGQFSLALFAFRITVRCLLK